MHRTTTQRSRGICAGISLVVLVTALGFFCQTSLVKLIQGRAHDLAVAIGLLILGMLALILFKNKSA